MPRKLEVAPPFEEMNHTELWQMAQRIGLANAGPHNAREELIHALKNLEDLKVPSPIDTYREDFSQWLQDNWDSLQLQVPKQHCPDCHLSPDIQVADCWLDNGHRVS